MVQLAISKTETVNRKGNLVTGYLAIVKQDDKVIRTFINVNEANVSMEANCYIRRVMKYNGRYKVTHDFEEEED